MAKPVLFQVDVIFPKRYPSAAPFFDIQKTWMISMHDRTFLSRKLTSIAMNFAAKSRPCLEAAIRYLMGNPAETIPGSPKSELESEISSVSSSVSHKSEKELKAPLEFTMAVPDDAISSTDDDDVLSIGEGLNSMAHEKDSHNVPFPVLCGASFTATGSFI